MNSSTVYPIGILVMGRELRLLEPRATLEKVQGMTPCGPPSHQVNPYVYNLVRFAAADLLVPFEMVKSSIIQIISIHAFGPALIERVVFDGTIIYDKLAEAEGEGKLFICPRRVLQAQHPLHVELRCMPELFMLGARHVEEPSTLTSDELALMRSHDSGQCEDCRDFLATTGLEQ